MGSVGQLQLLDISIHALREESDQLTEGVGRTRGAFLSTLSVRRATYVWCKNCKREVISIHALREESDMVKKCLIHCWKISIHALREESDAYATQLGATTPDFYPRSP